MKQYILAQFTSFIANMLELDHKYAIHTVTNMVAPCNVPTSILQHDLLLFNVARDVAWVGEGLIVCIEKDLFHVTVS